MEHVDFMSMDIEGQEIRALSGFYLAKYNIQKKRKKQICFIYK